MIEVPQGPPVTGVKAQSALLGVQLEPVAGGWVTFDGPWISEVGSGRPPRGVIDLGEGTLMPGLVDCHVHLTMSGSADIPSEVKKLTPVSATVVAIANAIRQLRSGVTTVRDLGSYDHVVVELAQVIESNELQLPTIVPAVALCPPEGHGHFLSTIAKGPDGFRRAVMEGAARGARAIKVFATGGVITPATTPGAAQMRPDELVATVKAAHDRGLPVAAHAHGSEGIAHSAEAKVDSIEHFSYLDDQAIETVRRSGATLVSTLVATERFVRSTDLERANPETVAKIKEHAPHERNSLRRAIKAKLPVVGGTDAGTTFNAHSGALAEQARYMSAAGMDPSDILRAITRNAAAALGEPAGVLEPGRRADCLLAADDPRADLACLSSIRAVILRGVLVIKKD